MSDDECPDLISAKVPVTILTGFLGSGKTTLLHYVLTVSHNLKIAVIVNEFEFGKTIEKGLTLKSSEKSDDEWVELKNGCMCCTAQTQTVKALESLIERKGTFDLVLVEASGLADPAPIAAMFWQDEALCGCLYLSGIVTLVDTVNIAKYLADSDVSKEATRQILMADKIILNKCDLTTEEQQAEVQALVTSMNPVAEVIKTDHSRVQDIKQILFIDTTRKVTDLEHLHAHDQSSIHSCSLEFYEPEQFLAVDTVRDIHLLGRDLLYRAEETGLDILRSKAAIWVRASSQPEEGGEEKKEEEKEEETKTTDGYSLYQFQSIGELFDVTPMEGVSVPQGCNRALVLGKNLDEEKLRSIFLTYLKPSAA